MAELDDLSITDASNTARFPENMQFRNVNDGARALEGMLAREYRDRNMSLATSGSGNAFSVTPNRTLTSLTDGLLIGFTANHSITGAATINVGGLGIRPIVSSNGSALVAGDIVSGQKLQIVFRAANNDWQIVGQRTTGSNADVTARVTPVGTIIPYGGSVLPAGYLWAAGGTVSRTAYAELFAVYGTTYGAGDGSTTFGLPDWRGRTPFGKDDMGGTAANRLTSTFGIDGATLGATGGAQSTTLITANLPAHNHTATVTDPGHTHAQTVTSDGGLTGPATGGGYPAYAFDGSQNTASAMTGISVSIGNTGSGSAFSNIPPGAVSNWIILALPAAASASTLGVNGHLYRWSTTTTDTDPGSGKLGFNNATLASATTLFISETDAASGPMANVLTLWDDSTSTVKGTLFVYKVGQLSTYCVFTVSGTITDAGAYAKFTVAHAASNGTFAADDQLSVLFVPKGDVGDPGAGLNWRSSWLTATSYAVADGVKNGGASYICTVAHTSGASTEPGVGASWTTVWDPIAEKGAAGSGSGDMVAANNLSDLANAATAFANIKQAATETATGVVELATTAEATTGTDTVRAVTPAGLKAHVDARNGTTASSAITDNRVARGDGGARGLQESPVGIDDSGNVSGVGYIELAEIAAPSTPASGFLRLYAKSDGKAYQKNDAGTETDLSQSGGGSGSPSTPQGRLTLTTATPVMTSTTSAQTTVYYTPYTGRYVPLYDGTTWTMTDIGGELSQATTDTTKSPAAVTTNSNYDLFVWNDGGTYRCTRGPAWSSDTSRGSGAGTTEIERVNGIWVNKVAITNGPGAQRGTYVGTIRSNGSSQIDWIFGALSAGGTAGVLNVWNAYNRVNIATAMRDTTDSYTYATASWRSAQGGTGMRANFVVGLVEDTFFAIYNCLGDMNTGGNSGAIGIGVNSTSTYTGTTGFVNVSSTLAMTASAISYPQLGNNYVTALEYCSAGTMTIRPDSSLPTFLQSGISINLRG